MRKSFASIFLCVVLVLGSFPAQADAITDQISTAIQSGQLQTVRELVKANPTKTDEVAQMLLAFVKDNVSAKLGLAAQAMTVAEQLVPNTSSGATLTIATLIKDITSQGVGLCAANSDSGLSGETDVQSLTTVLNGAQAIAQMPNIVAVKPELYAQVRSDCDQCMNNNQDVLLAQQPPSFTSLVLPFGQNPPPASSQPSAE